MSNERQDRQVTRLEQLCAEAQEKWPGSALADALENLRLEVVRKFMHALRGGIDVRGLDVDLQLLADESRRLQQQGERAGEVVTERYSFADTGIRQLH